MKKVLGLLSILTVLSCCCAFAAKYTVNTSGVVKNKGGVIASPSNTTNQNYFNNYSAPTYINNEVVNIEPVGIIEFVMDYSGSMSNWIGVAKRSMATIVSQIPYSTNIGFRVFGNDEYGNQPVGTLGEVKQIVMKKNNKFSVITKSSPVGSTSGVCRATRQVTAISAADPAALLNGMNSVNIGGATPLVYALDRAVYQDFAPFDKTAPKKIILITDGGENCGGDPCEFARQLMAKRNDVHIDVVLVSSSSRALTCLANLTGGHFYNTSNLADFSNVMTRSIQSQPAAVPNANINTNKEQYYEFVKDEYTGE